MKIKECGSILCLTAVASLSLFYASSVLAQDVPAKPSTVDLALQADVIGDVASKVRGTLLLRPNLVIEGDYVAPSMIVGAREIVFKPGSRIVFNDSTMNTAGAFFLVADVIKVEDPSNPGVITWSRTVPPVPDDKGFAQSGSVGGGAGAGGATGAIGFRGSNAPAITVIARSIGNGGLVVDATGASGGQGGTGQIGGTGGPGAQGSSARQARTKVLGATVWQPWCEAGPGHGGVGGTGGAGGVGGDGGMGGDGGNVTLVSLPEALSTLFTAVRVINNGGKGGPGGQGGLGGQGGPGGPEGKLANFCNSAGRGGPQGPQGAAGPLGTSGSPGRDGQPFVGNLTTEQFRGLFGFES